MMEHVGLAPASETRTSGNCIVNVNDVNGLAPTDAAFDASGVVSCLQSPSLSQHEGTTAAEAVISAVLSGSVGSVGWRDALSATLSILRSETKSAIVGLRGEVEERLCNHDAVRGGGFDISNNAEFLSLIDRISVLEKAFVNEQVAFFSFMPSYLLF